MSESIADLARRLADDAGAVCRHYLSNGRRQGRYWIVGDLDNNTGRSLYVRLYDANSGTGAAGKWTDAATGKHGDLLDLIAGACRLGAVHEVVAEARRFLSLPRHEGRGRTPAARSLIRQDPNRKSGRDAFGRPLSPPPCAFRRRRGPRARSGFVALSTGVKRSRTIRNDR